MVDSIEVMAETLGLFRELRKLAAAQKALALEGRMKEFRDHCSQRERLQRRIAANQRKHKQLRRTDEGSRSADRGNALRLDLAALIASIQAIDRETEALVTARRDEVLEGLKEIRRGLKALKGYGGHPGQRRPRFIDREG